MEYKAGWGEVKKRFERFWGPENFGPLVQIFVPPSPGGSAMPRPSWATTDDPGWWYMQWMQAAGRDGGDPAEFFADFEAGYLKRNRFLGDSYPQLWLNMGPGVLSAFLSGFLKFDGETTWFEHPAPLPWDRILEMELGEDNAWWAGLQKTTRTLARLCRGKCAIGMTDIGGATDILASLRTSMQLLEDFIYEQDRVLEATTRINQAWFKCFDTIHRILQEEGAEGSSAWMGLWSPKRWYPCQCDFSAMISPRHFERLVLPGLVEQARRLDHVIYHWDGPGEIPHLDLLLSVPEILGLQWVPGAAMPGCENERWYPLYERIQKAGKRVIAQGFPADRVEEFVRRFDAKGLFVTTQAETVEQGLALAERLGVPRG